jgi:hypothetical protein
MQKTLNINGHQMVYFYILSLSSTILENFILFFHIKTNLQYGKYMNQQTKHCCIEIHVSYKMLCELCTHTTQMQNI